MTGLATAPHLHFEVLVGGVAAQSARGAREQERHGRWTTADRARFVAVRGEYLTLLERGIVPRGRDQRVSRATPVGVTRRRFRACSPG